MVSGSAYHDVLADISELLEQARRSAAKAVNSLLAATYWEVGRRIVELEQGGKARIEVWRRTRQTPLSRSHREARAGLLPKKSRANEGFLSRLGNLADTVCHFRGKSQGLTFHGPAGPRESADSVCASSPPKVSLLRTFPLAWSHYSRLLAVDDIDARAFYEAEAIRGGWTVRQLDRQVSSQFYERTAHSKRRAAMLEKGQIALREDAISAHDEIRDPYLLEFLDLKDEYSEGELEEALVRHLEWFLVELGAGFTFVARQKRIRIGDSWYRIDLVFFHRGLRCLVLVDLKTGKFTHADAGQMNLYLNYAKENLTMPSEADPVGLILCSDKDDAVVRYAMGGIQAQVFASKYLAKLPPAEAVRQELLATKLSLESRATLHADTPPELAKALPTKVTRKNRKRTN